MDEKLSMEFQVQCQAFDTVARAIEFIRGNAKSQPSLEEVARYVGLSSFHLQRVFSEWAGISPKRFLQFLTKENAKRLLKETNDILSASYESGLSSPGRLHDLMVVCEAVTPGEIKALGDGLEIRFGFAPTLLGNVIAGMTERGVCHLHIFDSDDHETAIASLRNEWPYASFIRDDPAVANLSKRLFASRDANRPLHVLLRGTNFQIKVWEALLKVPAGEVVSYQSLAKRAGVPSAPRAVGTAVAKNNLAILIPCHRVIRGDGEIGEYRWGSARKAALLALEQAARNRT